MCTAPSCVMLSRLGVIVLVKDMQWSICNGEFAMGIRINGDCFHTPDIPNAWASKNANQLAGRTAIITDWDDISHSTAVLFYDFVEDIHQAVRCRAPTEDDYFPWIGSHGVEVQALGFT